ncbi:MAG: ATP-binding protein [Burkholderiales bacterium]
MKGSLQRRLTLTLSLAILVTGLVAALASFVFGYLEAQELQDDTLRQIAALTTPAAAGGDIAQLRRTPGVSGEQESRIMVMHLPQDIRPTWLPADLPPGFHTLQDVNEPMRVFVRDSSRGVRVIVAQPTNVRDEIAQNSALRTLVPVVLLLPLLAWLTARIVAAGLSPVRRLAQSLDTQSADRLAPLPVADVPHEISSFVAAINRLLERVNGLMGEQRRFVADAAHELRSPLTALSVQAQNIENAESLETAKARLAPLKTGLERAQRLTEQLLSLAKTQADANEPAEISVSNVIRELIAEYLPLAHAKEIDLGMEENAAQTISGSADVLRLILSNAIDNALRYTPRGGVVTVRVSREVRDTIVEVIDSGSGIPAADRTRAFDAFHRLEGSSGNGSGLGLAIARDAASRLGGVVSLHERVNGAGLVFRYRQPHETPQSNTVAQAST